MLNRVHLPGERDHLVFLLHAHAGFLEHLAEVAVDDGVGGKLFTPEKPIVLDLQKPVPHAAARIGGMHAADDGNFLHDGQHFVFADLHGDGVGIAVGHHAAVEPWPAHAEAAGIVDDDQVRAALLDEFGADAGAGARGDDGLALS